MDIYAQDSNTIARSDAVPKTDARYRDNGDNTITDTVTNLMWKKCAEGLTDADCDKGVIKKYTLAEAMEFAQNTEFAGHSDWRIPTYSELRTLVDCPNGSRDIVFDAAGYLMVTDDESNNGQCINKESEITINQNIFPNTPGKRFLDILILD